MIDYTKVYTQEKSYDEGLRTYMLKVYNFMSIALLISAISALATVFFKPLNNLMFQFDMYGNFMGNTIFGTIIQFAPLIIAGYFFMGYGSLTPEKARIVFWVYAGLVGSSLASLAYIYTTESIAYTFFVCSSLFGLMSLYGYTTKRDLTKMGSFLVMGLLGLILVSIANMFIKSTGMFYASSLVGVIIFTGLTAWDTQKIKAIYYQTAGDSSFTEKYAVYAAFQLYLDFINLFLYLLRFFGSRRSD